MVRKWFEKKMLLNLNKMKTQNKKIKYNHILIEIDKFSIF